MCEFNKITSLNLRAFSLFDIVILILIVVA